MINLFVQIIKIEKKNISIQSLIDHTLLGYSGSPDDHCTSCGRSHLKKLENYERWITEHKNGNIIETKIRTKRYKCECGHSHVVLPSVIVPYRHHSLMMILHALYDYFSQKLTVSEISLKYGISIPTLYRWRDQFLRDKEIWLKGLHNIDTSSYSFIHHLLSGKDFSVFAREFRQTVYPHRMILQNHKNAFLHQFV